MEEGVEKFCADVFKIHNCLQGNEPWPFQLSSKLPLYGLFIFVVILSLPKVFELREKISQFVCSRKDINKWRSLEEKCVESHEYFHALCTLLLQKVHCN
jgi:hypothetical protein